MSHLQHIAVAVLFLFVADAFPALAGDNPVRVDIVDKTYPVSHRGKQKPNYAPSYAAKLEGKTEYTTRAVVLHNGKLRIVILPELGGRVVEAQLINDDGKPHDLFWRFDKIVDGVSWSMGGMRWSFPFWEHGRHFDETAGYAIIRHDDGSVTVAMDMRFERFMKVEETKRYGRATNLRLGQYVKLEPGKAHFTWSARVDNPLPIRHGFKLWFLMRQPAVEGTHVILPTKAVTGHGAHKLIEWNADQTIGDTQNSLFAIQRANRPAGWYFPDRNLSVMAHWNADTAPGAKQVLYRPNPDKNNYVEMWGGNHEVFEECGRILPALGTYRMDVTIGAALGKPAKVEAMLANAVGKDEWPDVADDMPTGHFEDVQARVNGTMPGGRGLYEEATDLVTEHGGSLWRGRKRYVEEIGKSEHVPYDAFRRMLRTHHAKDVSSDALEPRGWQENEGRFVKSGWLEQQPRWVFYKTLRRTELEGQVTVRDKDEMALQRLRCGVYLLMLDAKRSGRLEKIPILIDQLRHQKSTRHEASLGEPALLPLQQAGSTSDPRHGKLLTTLVWMNQGDIAKARRLLQAMIDDDPANLEAWMLLAKLDKLQDRDSGAAKHVKTLTWRNDASRESAVRVLKALEEGRWLGIGRPQ